MKFVDLDGDGQVSWMEKTTQFFRAAFHFFNKEIVPTAVPLAATGLSIAAAVTDDPDVDKAAAIAGPASKILASVAAQAESHDGTTPITIDADVAKELVAAIVHKPGTSAQ